MEGLTKGSALCKHHHIQAMREVKNGGGSVKGSALYKHNHIHPVGEAKGGGGISERVCTMQAQSHTNFHRA
jgi:hypothetical protein